MSVIERPGDPGGPAPSLWKKRLPLLVLLLGVLVIGMSFARRSPRPVAVTYHYGPLAARVLELQVKYLQGEGDQQGEVHRALFRYAEGTAPPSQLHRFALAGGPALVRLELRLSGGEVRTFSRSVDIPAPLLKLSGQDGPHELSLDLTRDAEPARAASPPAPR